MSGRHRDRPAECGCNAHHQDITVLDVSHLVGDDPVSSSSLSILRIPRVAAAVAFLGFRPVANALGVSEGTMAT